MLSAAVMNENVYVEISSNELKEHARGEKRQKLNLFKSLDNFTN